MIKTSKLNLNQKVNISLSFLIVIVLSSLLTFSIAVFMLQVIFGAVTLYFIIKTDYKTAKVYLAIFSISLLFVCLVYIANYFNFGAPYYNGGSDDLKFEEWGMIVNNVGTISPNKLLNSGIIGTYNNSPFFVVYISLLMSFSHLFGEYSTFIPRIANVYFLLWICMLLKYFFMKYTKFSPTEIRYALGGFALMPNIQYVNSHVFRDTFNLLEILLIVFLFEILLNFRKIHLTIISILTLPFLIYFTYFTRPNSLAFAGITIILLLSERFKIKKSYMFFSFIFFTPIIVKSNLLESFRLTFYIETYSEYVSNIANDGLSRFVFSQPLIPLGVLFRAFYAFITPFPNFWGLFNNTRRILFDFVQLLIYLGVLIQIVAIPFVIKRIAKFDWLSLSFLSWFLAVIITTFTFRHVILYYPFMVAVAVDGYAGSSLKARKAILFFSSFISMCFAFIYVTLKIF